MPHELMGFWLSGPGAEAGTGGQAGTATGPDGGGAHAATTSRTIAVAGNALSIFIDTSRIPPVSAIEVGRRYPEVALLTRRPRSALAGPRSGPAAVANADRD